MKLFIGVEGIAMRFSVAVMADETGNVISAARGQSISLHTTPREVLRARLWNLISTLLHRAGLREKHLSDTILCIGLTGTTFSYDREVDLPHEISKMQLNFSRVICTGDAEIAFLSHTRSNSGSAIISHTGSTGYVLTHHKNKLYHVRFGGWGPAFGDDASAYAIGRSVLRAIEAEHDLKNNYSILWQKVDKWLYASAEMTDNPAWQKGSVIWQEIRNNFNVWNSKLKSGKADPRALLFYFSHNIQVDTQNRHEGIELWRRIASGLVIPLMEAYKAGDEVAHEIVNEATNSLSEQHSNAFEVAKKLYNARDIEPLVFYGGVLTHNKDLADKLLGKLNARYNRVIQPITTKTPFTMRPACGALLFALGNSTTDNLCKPSDRIIEQVYKSQLKEFFQEELDNE